MTENFVLHGFDLLTGAKFSSRGKNTFPRVFSLSPSFIRAKKNPSGKCSSLCWKILPLSESQTHVRNSFSAFGKEKWPQFSEGSFLSEYGRKVQLLQLEVNVSAIALKSEYLRYFFIFSANMRAAFCNIFRRISYFFLMGKYTW